MTLLTKIKQGQYTAFQEAYNTYHARLFYYFLKRARTEELAKDLTQQSFIKLWQSRQTLSENHSLDTQMFTIANSILIDHLRRQAVERKHQQRFENDSDRELSLVHRPHTAYESADYLDVISNKLPPIRRNVFMLKIAKGFSNKQVAEQLSVSIKTVEDHYSKALKHIRALVTIIFIVTTFTFLY